MSTVKTNKRIPKPRNPFVRHLITKKQGPHGRSAKAQRASDKIDLRREAVLCR